MADELINNFSKEYLFESLQHRWNDRFELNIENLSIKTGKCYALLGANGSGKSTLMQILAEKIQTFPDMKKAGITGYLPQKPHAFNMSVEENIRLGIPPAAKSNKKNLDFIIKDTMHNLGLSALSAANGCKLSGGEAQRMALARILSFKRKILLLDEPTTALDLTGLQLAEKAIKEYITKNNCILVLCTHHINLAQRLCDEMIFLDNGKVDTIGDLKKLLCQPSTEKLKQFLYFEQAACEL